MKRLLVLCVVLLVCYAFGKQANELMKRNITGDSNVAEVLISLGEKKPAHYLEEDWESWVNIGRDLVFKGKTDSPPPGEKSRFISRFYSCVSCHNTVREDPDLSLIDQDARLEYAASNRIPYLQGSTFWGIVNRETWYNDDYVHKYGQLVEKARNSLVESTQLCALVCSQGRVLDDWEVKAIISYYWSIQMKLSDLELSSEEMAKLESIAPEKAIELIKGKYLAKSPATFGELPEDKAHGYPYSGRPEMGEIIYKQGCMHCHKVEGVSNLVLDEYPSTFQWLKRNITSHGKLSIYEIIRKGTYSEKGHKEYMPHYTEEKLSDQQLEDLRSYIEKMAE